MTMTSSIFFAFLVNFIGVPDDASADHKYIQRLVNRRKSRQAVQNRRLSLPGAGVRQN